MLAIVAWILMLCLAAVGSALAAQARRPTVPAVIPAKAGIPLFLPTALEHRAERWEPVFRNNDATTRTLLSDSRSSQTKCNTRRTAAWAQSTRAKPLTPLD